MPRPKMCEDCKEKRANYGLLNTRERKWCFTCAERYGGVRLGQQQKMCEDCNEKHANYGLKGGKKQWCAT